MLIGQNICMQKITYGYCVSMNDNLISQNSKKQNDIAKSNVKTEDRDFKTEFVNSNDHLTYIFTKFLQESKINYICIKLDSLREY